MRNQSLTMRAHQLTGLAGPVTLRHLVRPRRAERLQHFSLVITREVLDAVDVNLYAPVVTQIQSPIVVTVPI